MGDLNAKHNNWNNTKNNAAGIIVNDFLQNTDFTLAFPRDHTYAPMTNKKKPSTIDLLLTNNKTHNSRPYVKNILTSDHLPVFVRIDTNHNLPPPSQPMRRNFLKAHWKNFRSQIDDILCSEFPLTTPTPSHASIDQLIDTLTKTTLLAVEDNVPLERINNKGHFLNEDIKNAIHTRNYFKRRWLRAHRAADKDEFIRLKKLINFMIANENRTRIEKKFKSFVPGDNGIYRHIKNRRRSNIPPLYANSNITQRIFDDEGKCQLLADHFAAMHVNPLARSDGVWTMAIEASASNTLKECNDTSFEPIHSSEVHRQIRLLKRGKASGPDNISPILIKNLSHLGIEFLTQIFNSCLAIGYYPYQWKLSCTVAVHKSGKDPNDRNSYRPIALLSNYSKIFERIINNRLTFFLDDNHIIPHQQFGFRRRHSPSHALLHTYNKIRTSLQSKQTLGLLSFDIEKAFDRVWHAGLIYKLSKLNFPYYIIKIIYSFIQSRKYFVKINSKTSVLKTVNWGVPQGSALSPTLYSIYVYDIPTKFDEKTELILFADDTTITTSDRLIGVITNRLSSSSQIVLQYYHRWKIKINTDKTTITCFTKRKTKQLPTEPFSICGSTIDWTDQVKFLGVTFDKRLTMRQHLTNTCNKADSVIRFLYPYLCRSSVVGEKTKIHIYKTYLRPLLTYAGPVTINSSKTNKKKLETKQNSCLRLLMDISWDSFTSTKEVENRCKIQGLTVFIENLTNNFTSKCKDSQNPLISNLYN